MIIWNKIRLLSKRAVQNKLLSHLLELLLRKEKKIKLYNSSTLHHHSATNKRYALEAFYHSYPSQPGGLPVPELLLYCSCSTWTQGKNRVVYMLIKMFARARSSKSSFVGGVGVFYWQHTVNVHHFHHPYSCPSRLRRRPIFLHLGYYFNYFSFLSCVCYMLCTCAYVPCELVVPFLIFDMSFTRRCERIPHPPSH